MLRGKRRTTKVDKNSDSDQRSMNVKCPLRFSNADPVDFSDFPWLLFRGRDDA